MKPHKWAKEIKAWADGAEIEFKASNGSWVLVQSPAWYSELYEFRIKPQPKEPQYLYAYKNNGHYGMEIKFWDYKTGASGYIGKIKLEIDDE